MLHYSRWFFFSVLGSVVVAALFLLPNFFPRETVQNWPSWMPSQQMVLGLDLQGGVEVVLPQRVFINVRASRFRKTGQRVFLSGGEQFDLGIPTTIASIPSPASDSIDSSTFHSPANDVSGSKRFCPSCM